MIIEIEIVMEMEMKMNIYYTGSGLKEWRSYDHPTGEVKYE